MAVYQASPVIRQIKLVWLCNSICSSESMINSTGAVLEMGQILSGKAE